MKDQHVWEFSYREQYSCSDSSSCSPSSDLLNSHPEAGDSEDSAEKAKQIFINMNWISINLQDTFNLYSYLKLLQWDLLLQESPHHAHHSVELLSRVLTIGDHFDEGQRRQLVLCDDRPVWGKTEWRDERIQAELQTWYKSKDPLTFHQKRFCV